MQNKQLTLKNILKYEIDQLTTKSTASIAKSTGTDAKPSHAMNKR